MLIVNNVIKQYILFFLDSTDLVAIVVPIVVVGICFIVAVVVIFVILRKKSQHPVNPKRCSTCRGRENLSYEMKETEENNEIAINS